MQGEENAGLLIDQLNIKIMHMIIEILISITYILTVIFVWLLDDKYIMD